MPFILEDDKRKLPPDFDWENDEPPPYRENEFTYMTPRESFGVNDFTNIPSFVTERNPAVSGGVFQRLRDLVRAKKPEINSTPSRPLLMELVNSLSELGVKTIYVSYDGGHDEGFSRIESFQTTTEKWTLDQFIARTSDRHARWIAFCPQEYGLESWSAGERLKNAIDWELSDFFSQAMFEGGFGAGEYCMFGRLIVNLVAGTIRDDPTARPSPQGYLDIQLRDA